MTSPPRAPGDGSRETVAALELVNRLQPALQRGERAEVVEILRQMAEQRAPMGEQWQPLAYLAADNGEVTLARSAIELFAESQGNTPRARFKKGALLARVGAFADALELLRGLSPDVPDPLSYALSRGGTALALGEAAEAREWLDRATRIGPRSGTAWHTLSRLVNFADEPELFERMVAAEATMETAGAGEFALYCYALGKGHADRGEPASAFAAAARGAREVRGDIPYSREADSQGAAEAVAGYDAARIAEIAGRQSEPTSKSIFVMGLPRSGTTLVEQVLTSHGDVSHGAEIDRLALLAREVRGTSFTALDGALGDGGASTLGRLWHYWLDECFPGSRRVVDKTNHSSRMLGLAASLLPEAPLIWLVRDPLECAWSCFRTGFIGTVPWAYDLKDIAHHFRLEDELLARWQDILRERLLVVRLEQLAADPEGEIRRILEHCGLDEQPQAFAPHANPRPVATVSAMQVRRPISPQAIGGAEPYREFLEPFAAAYYG